MGLMGMAYLSAEGRLRLWSGVVLTDSNPHGHSFGSADETGMGKFEGAGGFDVFDTFRKVLEENPDVHAGEAGPETVVLSDTKSEVRIRCAVDPKGKGIFEDRFIAISRCIEECNRIAFLDFSATDLGVPGRGAGEMVDGSAPADDFVRSQI